MASPKYARVNTCEPQSSDSEKGKAEAFLEPLSSRASDDDASYDTTPTHKTWLPSLRATIAIAPWVLTGVFATLSGIFFTRIQQLTHDTYETHFRSDLDVVGTVPLERVRFTGTPHFYLNGSSWLSPLNTSAAWPENKHYFGPPSEEIDENWERLIGGRYFEITEAEARRAYGERYTEYWDEKRHRYEAGLDVFHTLHCINAIRKALHPNDYPPSPFHGEAHVEHCLNILRQSVQCYGSTTLIPTRWFEGLHRDYIDSDQVHTCRSFKYLREWAWARTGDRKHYPEPGSPWTKLDD